MNRAFRRPGSPDRSAAAPRAAVLLLATLLTIACGCVNLGAMFSKMFLGDPQIDASFKQRTGVELKNKQVIIYCTAPATLPDEYSSIAFDLQKQISQRMELRGIKVISPNQVSRAVDDKGGQAEPAMLASTFPDVEYILIINLGNFDCREPNSPNLYRGFASGMIHGYAARGDADGARHASRIFEKEFQVEHPTHPVPRDSMSLSAFSKQFLDRLSDEIGRVFYDYRTSDIL
jgi:hypothetical protein